MECINPRFNITSPTTFVHSPENCKYYVDGKCFGQKYAPSCDGEDCDKYLS